MKNIKRYIIFAAVIIVCLLMTPFVSESPDGLESTLESFETVADDTPAVLDSPIPDYVFPGIKSPVLSVIIAGLCGTILCLLIGFVFARIIKGGKKNSKSPS